MSAAGERRTKRGKDAGRPNSSAIWPTEDAAPRRSAAARRARGLSDRPVGRDRYELAGPETLSYDEMSDLVSRVAGRPRPLVHTPLPIVRAGLIGLRNVFGEAVFATWEEAELMEVSMTSERGTADAEELGVVPRRMGDVLAEP